MPFQEMFTEIHLLYLCLHPALYLIILLFHPYIPVDKIQDRGYQPFFGRHHFIVGICNHQWKAQRLKDRGVDDVGGFIPLWGIHGLRVTWTLFSAELHSFMYAGLIHQLTFLFSIILVVAMSFSMLWMINARLVKSIRDLSRRDPLTQLYNRHALERRLPKLMSKVSKLHPLSIIMTDIDNFKTINDKHGHLAGDEAIKQVAKIIKAQTRNAYSAYRFGGDEILIILPKTSAKTASKLAELLRVTISACDFANNTKLQLTSSFGVACLQDGESWEQLVSRADQALYQAKQQGRNTVVSCSGLPISHSYGNLTITI